MDQRAVNKALDKHVYCFCIYHTFYNENMNSATKGNAWKIKKNPHRGITKQKKFARADKIMPTNSRTNAQAEFKKWFSRGIFQCSKKYG